MKTLISTIPFGQSDPAPLRLLESSGLDCTLNPLGRALTQEELCRMIEPYEALIGGGSDAITEAVLAAAPRLRIVARTGIGLDNVDLAAARRRGIVVTYTPDAPAPAVSELTIRHMLDALRSATRADQDLRAGQWRRHVGRRLEELTVGIIGVGRVGRRVLRHLQGFGPPRILLNDLVEDPRVAGGIWTDKETIYREADVITLHLPLTRRTRGLIGERELGLFKPRAVLVNTARGEILDEPALLEALTRRPDLTAALDVFAVEPYRGPLLRLPNALFSCHMGSCTEDCRLAMELGAATEIVRHAQGLPPARPAPQEDDE